MYPDRSVGWEQSLRVSVPKKMTHIWVGHKREPVEWMKTWEDLHPDWEYSVIRDDDFWGRSWILKDQMKEFYRRGHYNGVADCIRYETLFFDGGFIPPADAVCLNNVDELLSSSSDHCYTVYESEKFARDYVSPILASSPLNEFVGALIKEIGKKDPKKMASKVWAETGNAFVAMMIRRLRPAITIWPSHYFIPQHYSSDARYNGLDVIYADQMWGTTRGLYDE